MNNRDNGLPATLVFFFIFVIGLMPGNIFAQLVTNGGFESSDVGDITATGTSGWPVFFAELTQPPVFEIVSDTVAGGSRALKVSIHDIGANQWDIQAVADSIRVQQGATYTYSVWAKAREFGAQVNFTVGNYSFVEYGAIRPATLTAEWQEFTMQFTVNDNQTYIRAPIHFSYAGNSGNAIFLDNLRIADINFGRTPIVLEAESGVVGSSFSVQQDNDITYVTTTKNYTGLTAPEDTSSMITYQVSFQDSGYYNLFARLRVGPNAFDDDSFFAGRGFGEKDTSSTDWVFVNGLASAGFSNAEDVVNDPGIAGSQIWKWVNITRTYFPGDSPKDSFFVSLDSLSKTFQMGSREDGLSVDKFAFGKSNLYFTVNDLDNELPGSTTLERPDSSTFYQGPPFAIGSDKFLGNAYGGTDNIFGNYWNQLTPENAG